MHRLVGAACVDDGGEVVGEPRHRVRRNRLGHRRSADAAVVVTDHPEPLGELWHDPVPQHVGVGPAVDQHRGRAIGVALFVDGDANTVDAVDEALRGSLYYWHRNLRPPATYRGYQYT
jgi:hypothetical protein